MKWMIEEIMKMETFRVNPFSDDLISRNDVIDLLSRRCKDCKYYKVQIEPVGARCNKKREYCSNAVHTYGTTNRYTSGSDRGCKRFERREE